MFTGIAFAVCIDARPTNTSTFVPRKPVLLPSLSHHVHGLERQEGVGRLGVGARREHGHGLAVGILGEPIEQDLEGNRVLSA